MPCSRRFSDSRALIKLIRSCIAFEVCQLSVNIQNSPEPISEHRPIRIKKYCSTQP